MGWDYCRNWRDESDVVRSILINHELGNARRIVDHEMVDNVFWVLFDCVGTKVVTCFLVVSNGYKAMDLEMHPFYYNCPNRIVDATNDQYAKPWKEQRFKTPCYMGGS